MKKIILNPLFSGVLVLVMLVAFWACSYTLFPNNPVFFFDDEGPLEWMTYGFYGVAILTALYFARDFWKTDRQNTYFALLFLWLATLLREMGIQHWMTSHDTTAIKIRFFTNPNNPLHEKILSATVVMVVVAVALWLMIKWLPKMVKGFFRLNPMYWTIAVFGGVGFLSQVADRLPSNYYKATGERFGEELTYWLKLAEEGGESCLPVLFALAFIQYHILTLNNRRSK